MARKKVAADKSKAKADSSKDKTPTHSSPPICAIGAAAGGVKALQDFFGAVGDDLGLAYVVASHVAQEHPSDLTTVIAGRTRMPVHHAEDAVRFLPNHVYVIAPDREPAVAGDSLASRPVGEPRGKGATIDALFRSVAETRTEGFAVVLSGSGSDGALGIRAMNEAGHLIFVQDPNEAEYPMMPESALATGLADFVAPVPVLVQRIAEIARTRRPPPEAGEEDVDQNIARIIDLLHARTGHDFSHDKRSTVMRRVARRMTISRRGDLAGYVEYLRDEPQEAKELLGDLLVSVTSFFRDKQAFEALAKKVIQPIFERNAENAGVRIWVAGCATGEEAYSIAMLMLEQEAHGNVHVPIQIFASDLDEKALAVARQGRYPKAIAADVSEERLRRFFIEDGDHYRVRKEVRDLILFSAHSVLKDPPFIRVDLITCRNVLIYLDRELQSQTCAVLHYALKPDGHLFLGSAESIEIASELFRVVDREARIYATKLVGDRTALPRFLLEHHRTSAEHLPHRVDSATALANIHASALEHQSPPSALVDMDHRLLHVSANAGRFIRPSEGPVTTEVWQLVRQELRLDLKFALQRAFERKEATLTLPVLMDIDGEQRRVMAYVALTEAINGVAPHALVLFLDAGAGGPVSAPGGTDAALAEEKRRLVQELTMARERLNTSQRQYEAAMQELRSSNEELQSINEEYRSTSEELETSKEELQSINEELKTVNNELKNQLENVSSAHSDLQNMVAATEIGTLFLDRGLRIKLFTPSLVRHFNITESDLGRAITDFTHRLEYEDIENDARRVLKTLVPVKVEIKTRQGDSWLMMRILPYRTIDNQIDGVVVTFADVTEMKRVEESLAAELRAMARLQQISTKVVESVELEPPLLLILDATMELLQADFGLIQLYDEHSRKLRVVVQRGFDNDFLDRFGEMDGSESTAPGRALATRKQVFIHDVPHDADSQPGSGWAAAGRFRAVQSTPLIATGGKLVGMLSTHFREPRQFSSHDLRLIDICARQAADAINASLLQDSVRKSEIRLRQVLATETVAVMFIAEDGTVIDVNRGFLEMMGYSRADVDARELTWRKLTPPEWMAVSERQFENFKVSGFIGPYEKELLCKDGSRRWMLLAGRRLDDGTVAKFCIDISARKRAEDERELLARELSHRVKNTLAVVEALAFQTSGDSVEEFREKLSGRIHALAEATTMLLDSDWRSINLEELLRRAVSAYHVGDGGRAQIDGVHVDLPPKQALGLRLIVHELATNAVKYGAFSTDEGTLRLSWRVEKAGGERRVRLRWEERGGPAVRPPARTGFGAKLIRTACEFDLEGEARLDYAPEGLTCGITFPVL